MALAFAGLASAAEARSLALVIGNDAYANVTPLKKAVADSRAVGDELEKVGFIVRRAQNADQRALSRALAAFYAEVGPGDRALFFFSGHGFEISGANFLLPVDVPAAQANQFDIVRDAAVPVERVIDGIRERGAQVTILVLDACRDNPFTPLGTRGTAGTRGLARIDAPKRCEFGLHADFSSRSRKAGPDLGGNHQSDAGRGQRACRDRRLRPDAGLLRRGDRRHRPFRRRSEPCGGRRAR
jgi:Caspase domain